MLVKLNGMATKPVNNNKRRYETKIQNKIEKGKKSEKDSLMLQSNIKEEK